MSGYVPIPHDALAALPVENWHAVVDLFRRAHALRWRPFHVTEASLATSWNVSGRRVWVILDGLADLGLVEVHRGSNRKPTRIVVKCPTNEVKRSGQRSGQRNEPDETPNEDEGEGQAEGQNGPDLTRPRDVTRDRSPPPTPAQGAGASRAETRREWVAERALRELQEHDDPAGLLDRYDRAEGALVDAWCRLSRPRKTRRATLGGSEEVSIRAWPDAPSGLKQREIADGLARAAQRWRVLASAGERPP